jgi:hypothetical protein
MSRDLRDYPRKTNVRLAVGALLLLFVVGLGLIYFDLWRGSRQPWFLLPASRIDAGCAYPGHFFLYRWILKRAGRE